MSVDVEYTTFEKIVATVGKQNMEKVIQTKYYTEKDNLSARRRDLGPSNIILDQMNDLIETIGDTYDYNDEIDRCIRELDIGAHLGEIIILTDDFSSHPLLHTYSIDRRDDKLVYEIPEDIKNEPSIIDTYKIWFHECITVAGEDRIALYVIENQIDAMYHRRIHLTKKENIKVYCDILRNKWGCKIPKSWRIKTIDDVYKYGETYCSGYPSPCSKH